MDGPRAGRPHMPGYGVTAGPAGPLPWSWADEQRTARGLRAPEASAVRPAELAHTAPRGGVIAGAEPTTVGTADRDACAPSRPHAANASMRLLPEKAIGLREKDFTRTPTRWTFP
ncbi:hypothetical protein [Amycolatopsis sp. MEPSY49]|uniref:hypothetical protein n=1 Tax=Amycolatopsis sp. MEPSY49 TaxID=3151600 RepID=UPI003EF85959